MVSTDTLLNHTDFKIPLTVHAHVSDKQLGDIISQNNKPAAFFSRRLINPQLFYTMKEKELL